MSKVPGLCAFFFGVAALLSAHAGTMPILESGTDIEADGVPIAVSSGYSTPFVVDWNNDARKDLLIGQRSGGKVRLYLNQGTDTNPVFNAFSYLQAAGSDISLPGG